MPDSTVIPWDNQCFVFPGDIVQGMFSIVLRPDTAFNLSLPGLILYLPALYVHLLLSSSCYTIKQAWDLLIKRKEVEICRPLIQLLQMASNGTGLVSLLEVGAPAVALFIIVLASDENPFQHHHTFLHQALFSLAVNE